MIDPILFYLSFQTIDIKMYQAKQSISNGRIVNILPMALDIRKLVSVRYDHINHSRIPSEEKLSP